MQGVNNIEEYHVYVRVWHSESTKTVKNMGDGGKNIEWIGQSF
jgi:hypothetical protein